jgi:hypothetical protein
MINRRVIRFDIRLQHTLMRREEVKGIAPRCLGAAMAAEVIASRRCREAFGQDERQGFEDHRVTGGPQCNRLVTASRDLG